MPDRRAQIVDAALAVAQERGLAAMTMRSVAEHLGSSVMGLYRHVATKEELLDELVGRLLAEVDRAEPSQPWPQRLHHLAQQVFALAARYPSVVPLLMTQGRPGRPPHSVALPPHGRPGGPRAAHRALRAASPAAGP